jgi:hypothetical protein
VRAKLALIVAVAMLVWLVPATASAQTRQYPLRHDFSLVPGLPGGNDKTPTSCYDVGNPEDQYVCRLIYGYDEIDRRDYKVHHSDLKEHSDGSPGRWGHQLVDKNGYGYEGCHKQGWYWYCDYKTARYISRYHYKAKGYVLDVFWAWKDYVAGQQGSCALAVTVLWKSATSGKWAALLSSCRNGPPSSLGRDK